MSSEPAWPCSPVGVDCMSENWLAKGGGGGGNVASHRDNYRVRTCGSFKTRVCIVREGRSPDDGSRSWSFSSTEVNPSITRNAKKRLWPMKSPRRPPAMMSGNARWPLIPGWGTPDRKEMPGKQKPTSVGSWWIPSRGEFLTQKKKIREPCWPRATRMGLVTHRISNLDFLLSCAPHVAIVAAAGHSGTQIPAVDGWARST